MINHHWYAVHIIEICRLTQGIQKEIPVSENIIVLRAKNIEKAMTLANLVGKQIDDTPNQEIVSYIRKAEEICLIPEEDRLNTVWVHPNAETCFAGVRKIVEIQTDAETGDALTDGLEITRFVYEFPTLELAERFCEDDIITGTLLD